MNPVTAPFVPAALLFAPLAALAGAGVLWLICRLLHGPPVSFRLLLRQCILGEIFYFIAALFVVLLEQMNADIAWRLHNMLHPNDGVVLLLFILCALLPGLLYIVREVIIAD